MTAITIELNGVKVNDEVEPRQTLADFLRDRCGLTATHLGCEHGACGACTVLVNDEPVRSCLMFAVQADGAAVATVEGLSPGGEAALNPLQDAFRAEHGLQCGFCTPGILMSMTAFLRDCPDATDADIREALTGHLCRCTGYTNIVRAVKAAHDRLGR